MADLRDWGGGVEPSTSESSDQPDPTPPETVEGPIRVTEDGIHLPEAFRVADHVIIRAPTCTAESHLNGVRRPQPFGMIHAGHWDRDYLDGEGRTAAIRNTECLPDEGGPKVGLKIAGHAQHWVPVEVEFGSDDPSDGQHSA